MVRARDRRCGGGLGRRRGGRCGRRLPRLRPVSQTRRRLLLRPQSMWAEAARRRAPPCPFCTRPTSGGGTRQATAWAARFAWAEGPATRRPVGCPPGARALPNKAPRAQPIGHKEASMASPKRGAHADTEHRDPIRPAPGAHPVGVGAGAASAGAAGAALGAAVGGPIGAVVGAAVGAVAGGLGGKAAAEAVNPTIEDVGATSAASDAPDRSATGSGESE